MRIALWKRFFRTGALMGALSLSVALAASWLAGCSAGSPGTGPSLGGGLPTGGGGGNGPGGGNGGGGGGGGGTVPTPTPVPACGGGTLDATFSAVSNGNADITAFSATKVLGNAVNTAGAGSFTIVGTLCNPPATGNRTINIKVNQALVAGSSYSLSSGSTGDNFLQYIESTTSNGQTTEKSWTATAATLTVQSVTGKTVAFRVQNATMAPDPDFFVSNATGTFSLSFAGTVTAVNGL